MIRGSWIELPFWGDQGISWSGDRSSTKKSPTCFGAKNLLALAIVREEKRRSPQPQPRQPSEPVQACVAHELHHGAAPARFEVLDAGRFRGRRAQVEPAHAGARHLAA